MTTLTEEQQGALESFSSGFTNASATDPVMRSLIDIGFIRRGPIFNASAANIPYVMTNAGRAHLGLDALPDND